MRLLPAAALLTGEFWFITTTSGPIHTVPQQDRSWSPADRPSASVSADGRYVAFASYARLAAADTNRVRDIYVLDRGTGRVTLESLTARGEVAQAGSGHPRISGDGRFIVYVTTLPGVADTSVVLRDRRDGALTAISIGAGGEPPDGRSRDPVISSDGRVVAFSSAATNLVAETDANGAGDDVYLYETATRTLSRLDAERGGLRPNTGVSVSPALSADGRFIAFSSAAQVIGDRHERAKRTTLAIYVIDRERGELKRVSAPARGQVADGPSWDPAMSADGRFVAFVSLATNLASGDRNRSPDVFLADVQQGSIELVSRNPDSRRPANARSLAPAVSADARFVAFQSEASDLVCARRCGTDREDINLLWDVFLFDRIEGTIRRVSGDTKGGWMAPSAGPAIDPSGSLVVFSSRQPTDGSDTANDFDLFLCAAALRTTAFGVLRQGPHRFHH